MSKKKAADDATVNAFMAAVFPDALQLAIAAFDEQHVLTTATKLICDLRRELAMERCPFGSDDPDDECGCHAHQELRTRELAQKGQR